MHGRAHSLGADSTSISVPYINHQLMLGTWQGTYLWEHRFAPHTRELAIHVAE